MRERCVQIYCVVVATSILADTQRPGPSQVTDDSPHRSPREAHGVSDVSYGALRVRGDVKEKSAVTGRKKPLLAWGVHNRHSNSSKYVAAMTYYYSFSGLQRGELNKFAVSLTQLLLTALMGCSAEQMERITWVGLRIGGDRPDFYSRGLDVGCGVGGYLLLLMKEREP